MKPTPVRMPSGRPHQIEGDRVTFLVLRGGQENIGLDHGDGGRDADEQGGAQAGRVLMRASVETDDEACGDGQCEPQGDVGGGERLRHRASR